MEHHHHRFLFFSLVAVIVGGVIAAGGFWAYWNFWERFRPVTIAKNQTEIQRLLDEADWVSPGRSGPPIWMITYRDCTDCTAYQREEFPKLAAANIDTRVIVFARPDHEGLQESTPAERATIAELWINRDWSLYAKWMATPHKDWAADGLKPADHDFARNAVVNATRDYVNQMTPLLKAAGLGDAYPILIWRDHDGFLKACACTDERSYHFIRSDLGAPGEAKKLLDEVKSAISNATNTATNATAPTKKPAPAAAPPAPAPSPAPATTAPAASSPPVTQPQAATQGNSMVRAPRRHSNARAVFY
ncbi:MAG TPA: hypothetical protein VGL66_08785 [Caulobacteraceae bacterium]|jgi:hypothetical protein